MAPRLISTEEAARRLGVKPSTLYAYVSRGMIHSHRVAGERTSRFDAAEIDGLAGDRRGARRAGLDLGIATAITLIDGRRLWYRGRDATGLARSESFEAVASFLWTGRMEAEPFAAGTDGLAAARRAGAGLGPGARLVDRLSVAVPVAASHDPLRFDLSPPAVAAAGRALIAVMVAALPGPAPAPPVGPGPRGPGPGPVGPPGPLADRLWARLAPGPLTAAAAGIMNGFLVLLADHELATSTLGARVAASTRANPYAVVASALGVLDGPLHGTVSDQVVALLDEATRAGGPRAAVGSWLRQGRPLPGFGHALYDGADPRGAAMLDLVGSLAGAGGGGAGRWEIVQAVMAAASRHTPSLPNSDFGLGALVFVAAMPADAGAAVFAIARTAGWIAHAIEEYGEAPLRLRGRALYTGPAPTGR